MSIRNQLLSLQWAQLRHDEAYHKDVVILPLATRMKHMALHNAKYTAYLWEAADSNDTDRTIRTITDAFIITLASANTLNQDLGRELDDASRVVSLEALGAEISDRMKYDAEDRLWLVKQYALHNGRLSKICESWDHLESMPFRDGMKEANLSLLQALVAESSARRLDLADLYRLRIRAVETRSIFDSYYREGAGGEA